MNILLTGGAGYIGSHTAVELLKAGHEVIVVDDLSNSHPEAIKRVKQITGKEAVFYQEDVCDTEALKRIFSASPIDAVIHFAGLKSVGESVSHPLKYYRTNIVSTLALCEAMQQHGVFNLIFSSSATVYGPPSELPLRETSQVGVGLTNPYGKTKYMIEEILKDLAVADERWRITLLRYFNPIGAHSSGLIGEDPSGTPNNLLPYITQVAVGKLEELQIKGGDYDTPDGTGVRDYIHVVDLARGHLAAMQHDPGAGKVAVYNLCTGKGVSVLEMVRAFEAASGKKVPYSIVDRRPGDIAACYADATLANTELGWSATHSLEDGCRDSWNWQSNNPNGYAGNNHQ